MTIKNIGSNKTEVSKSDGTLVLISYSTPVAAFVPGRGWVRTSQHWSTTTSKHINQWLGSQRAGNVREVPQSELNALV